jgi:hypothetical protein
MKIPMCNCDKKSLNRGMSSAMHITEVNEDDPDVCKYCEHYVHWRTHLDYDIPIYVYVPLETRDENAMARNLTKDEAYIYGHKVVK